MWVANVHKSSFAAAINPQIADEIIADYTNFRFSLQNGNLDDQANALDLRQLKKAATIFLLAIFISAQTPFGQLLKLPILLEHFYQHRSDTGVSLLYFLTDHYSADHNDADQNEDDQLPFKTVQLHLVGFAVVPSFLMTDSSPDFVAPKTVRLQHFNIPEQYCGSIFHPPRA